MAFKKPSQFVGMFLLVLVNVVWVGASELAQYLFTDLNFKRPIFYTYFKSCMLSVFTLWYFFVECQSNKRKISTSSEGVHYTKLDNCDEEEEGYGLENLTSAEFEPISSLEICSNATTTSNNTDQYPLIMDDPFDESIDHVSSSRLSASNLQSLGYKKFRRVRFSMFREVRTLPERIANDAKQARLPYKPKAINFHDLFCGDGFQSLIFSYTVYFAPLWILSSVTYHAALVYSTLSSVNLISSSSSLFVLILGGLFGRQPSDAFTFVKLLLVVLNLVGVAIVSHFSGSWFGAALSLLSAFVSAVWLLVFSNVSARLGKVDMNLLLGITGIFTIVICSPLMLLAHVTNLEPQLPLATSSQMFIVVFNGFFGTLLGDFLWLYATLLTGSLTSTLSMTLSIPLSMLADAIFRKQPPDAAQIIASFPILISFIGATFVAPSHPHGGDTTPTTHKKQHLNGKINLKSTDLLPNSSRFNSKKESAELFPGNSSLITSAEINSA